jgi:hypothetical protein
MNIIPRRVHGILDYVVAVLLILSPRIFGFDSAAAEARVPVILGWVTLAYSLLTNYELGLFKVLPFRAHLTIDMIGGLFLAVSPWLFAFSDRVWGPHLVIGLLEVGAVLMTRTAASEQGEVAGTPAPR